MTIPELALQVCALTFLRTCTNVAWVDSIGLIFENKDICQARAMAISRPPKTFRAEPMRRKTTNPKVHHPLECIGERT